MKEAEKREIMRSFLKPALTKKGRRNFRENKESKSMPEKELGEIKFWKSDRHFGFITSNGQDYFFHGSCFEGDPSSLQGGELVSFVIGKNPVSGRTRAEKVTLTKE